MIKKAYGTLNYVLKTYLALIVILISLFSALFSCSFKTASAYCVKDFFANLFGLNTQTSTQTNTMVYLGGMPLGFTLECNGVVVIAVGQVHTTNGVKNTILEGNIQAGDVVTHIDNVQITSVKTIEQQMELQNQVQKVVRLSVTTQDNGQKSVSVMPQKDIITNNYKLGLWVRDNSAGVGTLTYVKEDDLRFGALGHSVCDIDTNRQLPLLKGNVYKCNIVAVDPSKKGAAGELKGLFMRGGTQIGSVDKNLNCGVFGTASTDLVSKLSTKLMVATKSQVKTGRASIFCCVEGTNVKEYSIEIIKSIIRSKDDNKSMVIRITDPQLISKTGGIVQGMSGSPIVQNGMLVGAVTHVFISDPTKGYGIFAQTMVENGQ